MLVGSGLNNSGPRFNGDLWGACTMFRGIGVVQVPLKFIDCEEVNGFVKTNPRLGQRSDSSS